MRRFEMSGNRYLLWAIQATFLLSISGYLGLLVCPAEAAEDQALGRFGDWEAHKLPRGKSAVCYALAIPKTKRPKHVNRDQTYVTVSYWLGKRASPEPSIVAGYSYRRGSTTYATIKEHRFGFFTSGDGAWLRRASDEARLVEAMRKGSIMVVVGISARGTRTTDSYSLIGFAAALQEAARACRSGGSRG